MSANNYVKQLRSRSLEGIRKDDPQSAEALEVRYGLDDETDRGCALMAAAYIEARLETLLKAYFVDDHQVTRKVLNGPVGSISSRTRMAYCLGLISFDLHEAILLISEIRNKFAHNHQALNFENPPIKSLATNFSYRRMFRPMCRPVVCS